MSFIKRAKPALLSREQATEEIRRAVQRDLTIRLMKSEFSGRLSDGSRFNVTANIRFNMTDFDLDIDWTDR